MHVHATVEKDYVYSELEVKLFDALQKVLRESIPIGVAADILEAGSKATSKKRSAGT